MYVNEKDGIMDQADGVSVGKSVSHRWRNTKWNSTPEKYIFFCYNGYSNSLINKICPASILYKSIVGRYRPVSYGPL